MKIEVEKYDFCSKITKDYYAEKGWIKIISASDFSIEITNGRKKDGSANIKKFKDGIEELDFCNTKCLLGYLENNRK